ncbi:MAG: hypothetical protein PHY48_15380 [Candidatus Cloacimonetes bacterium]|nr:hypothetical protein [Candidatus Cloacimonadota bacterium]
MDAIVQSANRMISDRGISGVVPALALFGVATVGFYSVILGKAIANVVKGGNTNG